MSVQRPGQTTNNNQQTALGVAFQEAGVSPSLDQPQTTAAPTAASAPQQRTTSNTTSSNTLKSAMDIDSYLNRDVSRRVIGETTHALSEALKKHLATITTSANKNLYQIHVMDSAQAGVHFSNILICKAVALQGKPVVSVFSLVVEASNQKLPPRPIQIQGTTYPVPTVAGDAIDGVLREKTITFLKGIYGAEATVLIAGTRVLYSETTNAADEAQVANLIWLGSEATSAALVSEKVVSESPIDVKVLTNGASTVAGIDWAPPPTTDIAGLPVRSDFSITTRSVSDQNAAQWSPNASSSKELVRVEGFVDLDYSIPQSSQQQIYGAPQVPPTQRYVPRVVLTRVNSLVSAETPELQLLALATTTLLGVNNSWMQAFKPTWQANAKKGDLNLRDVTAIGLEVNLTGGDKPARLPAASQADMGKFYQLLALAIAKDPIISMDIEEAGDLTFLQRDLYLSAVGDAGASNRIVESTNRLTDGIFGTMWDGSKPIAVDEKNRVPLGFWQSNSGLRDIRELDYVAMLNIAGEKDMQVLHDWSATFYNTQVPEEIRLDRRHRIQSELLSGYTLKGYARRIALHPAFLGTLAQALRKAGLLMQSQDTLVDLTGQTIRGNYHTANLGLDVAGQGIQLFSSGASGYGNYRGMGASPLSYGVGGLGR